MPTPSQKNASRKAMQAKPTKEQLRLALNTQAPIEPPTMQRSTKRRTLSQAGVGFDDSLEFFKADDWYETEDQIESATFDILDAHRSTKGQWGPKVIFKLKELATGEVSLCSLPENEPRLKFAQAFKVDTTPIGPCQFVKFDSGKGNPYHDIQMVEAEEEIPF